MLSDTDLRHPPEVIRVKYDTKREQVEWTRNKETGRYFKIICAKDKQRNEATIEELLRL